MSIKARFTLFLIVVIQIASFAQPNDHLKPITRYSALALCSDENSASIWPANKALITLSQPAKEFPTLIAQLSALSNQNLIKVLEPVEQRRILENRQHQTWSRPDFHRAGSGRVKLGPGSTWSVSAGSDISGGAFGGSAQPSLSMPSFLIALQPNRPLYARSSGSQSACLSYIESADSKRVFIYDGFEEVAVVYKNGRAECSAVIVGQGHALTAGHCAESGMLLIPTKSSRILGSISPRQSSGCSFEKQYYHECEFEVVKYTNAGKYSYQPREIQFVKPAISKFDIKKAPDLRLVKFDRNNDFFKSQQPLTTAKLTSYTEVIGKLKQPYQFVHAGYGHSFETVSVVLTIGAWKSDELPSTTKVEEFDKSERNAFVALPHPTTLSARVCAGDSGGALFFETPSGLEANQKGAGTRQLVGIISAAHAGDSADKCLQSSGQMVQAINKRHFECLCKWANGQINGCENFKQSWCEQKQ